MSAISLAIRSIQLTNYKNYDFRQFDLSEKINLIVGNNGLGKTNLLDALYYSCMTKSNLTSADAMVIRFGEDFFRIAANICKDEVEHFVEVKYRRQEKKEILLDRLKMERQADFIGRFPCVMITPDDHQLISGSSEQRRRFMDVTISQFSQEYLAQLMLYNKVLQQRNALLKSFYEQRRFDRSLLDVYTEKLVSAGRIISRYRMDLVHQLVPVFHQVYRQIFEGNEGVEIIYDSDVQQADYAAVMAAAEQQDTQAQRTTRGIHTDDLQLELNGMPLRKIGSQGQQKTFLLSLKLAQYELLKANKGCKPLLLLDDIFDKLDPQRIAAIFRLVSSDAYGQVCITDTKEREIGVLLQENNIQSFKFIPLGQV